MLQVQNISRRYGSHLAVDDVSFTIKKGEIIGLLGHNGAGKTTIMKMLSGYLEADSGQILLDGLDIQQQRRLIQQQLGYLPEHLPLYPDMTVLDYLDYAASLKALSSESRAAEIRRVVAATMLQDKLEAKIETLSRGYKQRLSVAQAILGKPRLLILDEPTNGLDPSQTLQMRELIQQIAQDATVILSTHIMQEVQALCSRVLLIQQGRLVLDRALDALTPDSVLQLGCDIPLEALKQLLCDMPQVLAVKPQSEHCFRLELAADSDHKALCAQVAQRLVNAGHALYQLHLQQQDLQSLFSSHHQKTEVKDAA
ncbi:ABC transporter ATP-binding protein [Rheinheimera mesophila]|uniref:ABC transporter ATP-binding protein n=1 Tax=Rheinheimera mesophila TaxID=1547515 RepID=A0A3P3QEC0_9GAMM|nr:ABC transporter ATP-binding protein [Rheinheimera mesophila]KKL03116.1 multidrug ABC transporter ATP-binding protein [Rheinheimera mesophila]RRJ19532.1 ABC transporter ATP-binding protein [Rheinheimera mesophila]